MKTEISLAIITKNRNKELKECLASILNQDLKPDEIIVVDNDENFSAKKIIEDKRYKKLNFSYYQVQGSVPKCRNFALKKSKSKYLGFIDDDCVLQKNWFKNGLSSIKKNRSVYVLGKTLLLNPNNIFALGQYARDDFWKDYNSQIFDTKNVILDLDQIKAKKIKFDEKCQREFYDSADFDLDFALKEAKAIGVFCSQMVLHHQETKIFSRFRKRAHARGFLAKYLDRKWQLSDNLVDLRTRNLTFWFLKMIKDFLDDFKKYGKHMDSTVKTPLYKKILATFVIKLFERYYVLGYVANKKTK